MKNLSITVCIPTYNRRDLLKEAIASCFAQTRKPEVILVGDDSPDDDTETLIRSLIVPDGTVLQYIHNRPGLGQNDNVNMLFNATTSTHLVLLHDDDLLLPTALQDLASCWQAHEDLTAAFGNQYLISPDGSILEDESAALNPIYYRTADREGLQPDWFPGLSHQFPNDCYMVKTAAAQTTLYRSKDEVGDAGDFDFGVRLCNTHKGFYFINRYAAKYRKGQQAISNSSKYDGTVVVYRLIENADVRAEAEPLRESRLKDVAPAAIMDAANLGLANEAARMYWGPYHPWYKRLSPGGVRRLMAILRATFRPSRSALAH
jgi:glycosyltransferase involved in cell wall biosynthesis